MTTPPAPLPNWTPREVAAAPLSTPDAAGDTLDHDIFAVAGTWTPGAAAVDQPASMAPAGYDHLPPGYTYDPPERTTGSKSFVAAWLLSWFFGGWGVDRFYLGKVGTGILKLVTFGGLGIWALVDYILILTGVMRDSNGLKMEGFDRHKIVAWSITGGLLALSLVLNLTGVTAALLSGMP